MELAYNLFVSVFTAILFSFLVAKLVSFAVSGSDGSGENVLSTGVEEGKLENRLKARGLNSKKKRLKKISSDTVRDSDFKGKTESTDPAKIKGLIKTDDFVDDCEKSCSAEKAIEIPGRGVEFSGIQKQDDYFSVDDPMKKPLNQRILVFPVQNEDNVISDEEEWEGIERNELEKDFVRAMNYVKQDRMNKLGNDAIKQFHDLQKVAIEGPCKLSNRANWNSWQKSGSMNPEEAMEKYITLLSDKVPAWIDDHIYDEDV